MMNLIKNNVWNIFISVLMIYIYILLPKYFYGDSLFFLELFETNNWYLPNILIEWKQLYGFYRIIGIVIIFLFYLMSFGNIYILLLLQMLLYIYVILKLSKQISIDKKALPLSLFFICCIPFSINLLIQPISFHQLVSTYILLVVLEKYFSQNSIKNGILAINSPQLIFLLIISVFIYEIAFMLLLLLIIVSIIKSKINFINILSILIFISLVLLISVNDKTSYFPDSDHLKESFAFQINRYFYYAVYFFKYCIASFLQHYSNLFNISLLLSLIILLFIDNTSVITKYSKSKHSQNYFVFLTLISVWIFYPIYYFLLFYFNFSLLHFIFTFPFSSFSHYQSLSTLPITFSYKIFSSHLFTYSLNFHFFFPFFYPLYIFFFHTYILFIH